MELKLSFRFTNAALNKRFVDRLKTANIKHSVDDDGNVHYGADDEERVENDLLQKIRDQVFPSWQILFCPPEWATRYQAYMNDHKVPFELQWVEDQPCYLLPRQYRPHTWKLADRAGKKPALVTAGQ